MLTDAEIAFLRAKLDEDRAVAREAAGLTENWVAEEPAIGVVLVDGEPLIEGHITGLTAHIARHDPARVLREVAVWRRLLLDYSTPPGTDAGYGGSERETGFRLALSAALKAKIATYPGNPVTGEPFPSAASERLTRWIPGSS